MKVEDKKIKVLVTGGSGFIGSNLVKKLKEEGYDVFSIDNYFTGKKENEIEGVRYYNLDIQNIDSLPEEDFKVVFHLGNYSRIVPSFVEIEQVWGSNFIGTFRVLEFCRKRNIKLVYAGSSTKFSKEGISHSPYSFTKATSVEVIKNYSKWYNLNYSICYFYNVFGPGYDSTPVPGYESVISVFEKQWRKKIPLTICGDGMQKRSFTYVGDVVDGIIKSWKYPINEEFQLDSFDQYTILEIANMFGGVIEHIPGREGDRRESVSTSSVSLDLIDWKSTMTIKQWIEKIKKDYEDI